jgi:hypothetical protein
VGVYPLSDFGTKIEIRGWKHLWERASLLLGCDHENVETERGTVTRASFFHFSHEVWSRDVGGVFVDAKYAEEVSIPDAIHQFGDAGGMSKDGANRERIMVTMITMICTLNVFLSTRP